MKLLGGEERCISPVIGVILMVAITVLLAVVAGVFFTGFDDKLNGNTANAKVSFEENPVGLEMVVEVITIEADVRLNGKTIGTIDEGDAGRSMLLPTSPGDRITIVSGDNTQSVLVDKTAESRDEIGDFIAYYDFEDDETPNILVDKAKNGNDATIHGSPTWNDGSMTLEGNGHTSGDWMEVADLSSPEPVSEFTIAVSYKQETTDNTQQLVEHGFAGGEWALQTWPATRCYTGCGDTKYGYQFRNGHKNIFTSPVYEPGQRRVVVGTYDKSSKEFKLYVDGSQVGPTKTNTIKVDMKQFFIGKNYGPNTEYFDGELFEIRLYHSAFDEEDIKVITKAMQ